MSSFFLQFVPKSFVDPRQCFVAFNHYCLQSSTSQTVTVHVNPNIARSHHYRKCGFTSSVCRDYYRQQTVDNTALRFKDKLQPAVDHVLQILGHRSAQ